MSSRGSLLGGGLYTEKKRYYLTVINFEAALYALNPHHTIIVMGDMNVDLNSRPGSDSEALKSRMTKLGLVSYAEARWGHRQLRFKTHRAGKGQSPSNIDYILVSEHHAASVCKFGVDADPMLMHDFDHAVLFADVE